MHANASQLGLLLFVLAALCAAAAIGLMTLALVFDRTSGARLVARLALAGGGVYLAVLVITAVLARGTTLQAGEEKHFCEIDCHLAYAVTGVSTAETLGTGDAVARARGTFHVVTLRVRFDAGTASPERGASPLWPNPRRVEVRDAGGNRYRPSVEGRAAWEAEHGTVAGLDRPLRPGEAYATTLVFDLPDTAREPRLLLVDPLPFTALIIGHENSPFHGKVAFALRAGATASAAPAP